MMVSKVAVIALVAIIAVPILMGYAFNLDEVQETDWKLTGDPVNVTSLLKNDSEYTKVQANTYQLNTSFYNGGAAHMMPVFESRTSERSSLYLVEGVNAGLQGPDYDMWTSEYVYLIVTDSNETKHLGMRIYYVDSNNQEHAYSGNIGHVIDLSYEDSTKTLNYSYITYSGTYSGVQTGSYTNEKIRIKFTNNGGYDPTTDGYYFYKSASSDLSASNWVDFSAGFRLINHHQTINQPYVWSTTPGASVVFPQNTTSAILTMDLDSITDPSYSLLVGNPLFYLNKTTTAGVVSWQIVDYYDPTNIIDLYYNQSGGNVYQLYFYFDANGEPTGTPGYYDYNAHIQFRYVGNWPELIGPADYYLSYDFTYTVTDDKYPGFSGIVLQGAYQTPIMRVDAAEYLALQYQVIRDQTYDPSAFKTNPSTKISGASHLGYSLEFGGNTYVVSNEGTISLSGHDIPVSNLTLSSTPDGNGGYENKIGNTVVSTSASPSTIVFNGSWDVIVNTQSLESYTITKTEWKAGSFAWNGIDDNFLLCGLITCIGVFIGCGIYARKNGTGGLLPLMIVTGCAAAVFFLML